MGFFDSLIKSFRPQILASTPTKIVNGLPAIVNGQIDPNNPWYMASDPHVCFLPDYLGGPSMLFTGIRATDGLMCTRVARMPSTASSDPKTWVFDSSPIIEPPNNGWDGQAVETPCYVKGVANGREVHRIYFMGRPHDEAGMPPIRSAIGFSEWNPTSRTWDKRPIPVIMPTESWESIPNIGYALGDQSVVYDEARKKWYCFYHASSPDLKVVLGYADSDDGVVWSNKQIVNWMPPSVSSDYPYGPYHLAVTVFQGKWYFVGWVGRSSIPYRGLWVTTSTGPLKTRSQDFSNWQPLLYEDSASWFTPNPTYATEQTKHQIGLFSAQMFCTSSELQLFFHAVSKTDDGTSNVANVGRASLSTKIFAV